MKWKSLLNTSEKIISRDRVCGDENEQRIA